MRATRDGKTLEDPEPPDVGKPPYGIEPPNGVEPLVGEEPPDGAEPADDVRLSEEPGRIKVGRRLAA